MKLKKKNTEKQTRQAYQTPQPGSCERDIKLKKNDSKTLDIIHQTRSPDNGIGVKK
jgi:hypothetical protein